MELEHYKYLFSQLHTARIKGLPAPHKAILLLTIIKMVETNAIKDCNIKLSDNLISTFKQTWAENVNPSSLFTCDISKPFFHMQHEPFWRLVEKNETINEVAENLGLYSKEKKELPQTRYTIKSLRENFDFARIDVPLFELLTDTDSAQSLQDVLLKTYINI